MNRYQEITKENEVFSVKTGTFRNGQVLILNESTAQALIKTKDFFVKERMDPNLDL